MRAISILGDSISTYEGYNPKGYSVFYDKDMQLDNGLSGVEDTWWMQVIRSLGGCLCVNDSFSGSRVSGLSFPAGVSDERIKALRNEESIPDVILVYLGYNDFGYGVEIDKSSLFAKKDLTTFKNAYDQMLIKIKQTYPKAVTVCGTLMKTGVKEYPEWEFPEKYAGISIDLYNKTIRSLCKTRKVMLADIAESDQRCETLDGSHPTKEGHKVLAEEWIKCLSKYKNII